MKILHIISSINPKGGGPMEGVRQVGMKKIEMGHSISVLTLDDPASPFIEDYPFKVHAIGPSMRVSRILCKRRLITAEASSPQTE
jgi:hypothetical protein